MTTYGDVRGWDPAPLASASTDLRADLRVLERAADALETRAVPESWIGFSNILARLRRDGLVAQMRTHITGVSAFERAVFAAQAQVATLEATVSDLDHDAASQEFTIGADGTITDVATPEPFISIRAAEAYTANRITLRDALVESVRAVLVRADEIDGALVRARPVTGFSAAAPQGVVDPAVARQWGEMTPAEREAVLGTIAEELAEGYGVDDFEIRFEDLEDRDGDGVDDNPTTDSHGSWSDGDRVLRIDLNDTDDPDTLNTIAHEVRHAAQNENVRDAHPSAFDQFLIDVGSKDDPFDPPAGVTREEVDTWRDNFDDYQTSAGDGFDAYYEQPVEADAREAGAAYVDQLSGDDLAAYLEGVR